MRKFLVLSSLLFLAFVMISGRLSAQSAGPDTQIADKDDWTKAVSQNPPDEPTDDARAVRKARGAVFDDTTGTKKPLDSDNSSEKTGHGMSVYNLRIPPLPSAQADAVLVGTVTGFQAYFSNDRTTIYTELQVQVEKILKDTKQVVNNPLTILYLGGAIHLPNGEIAREFTIPDEDRLYPGKRYVLFLDHSPKTTSFVILKAWELRDGRSEPLAYSDIKDQTQNSSKYAGMPEDEFLDAVQESIDSSSR